MGVQGTLRAVAKKQKLITNWGLSLREKSSVELLTWKCYETVSSSPDCVLCCELRTGISFCSSFLFLFGDFNRFARFRFCCFSKDAETCSWKSKTIWQGRRPGWEELCGSREPPAVLPSFCFADPFQRLLFFVCFSLLTKHVTVDPAAHNSSLDGKWNPVTRRHQILLSMKFCSFQTVINIW